MNRLRVFVFFSVLCLFACGDDGALSIEAAAASFCAGEAMLDEMCGDEPEPAAECEADVRSFLPFFRSDVYADLIDCTSARACDDSDDPCFTARGLGVASTPGSEAYGERCLAKIQGCAEEGFSNDLCEATILTAETVGALDACLALPCSDAGTCLTRVFGDG
ncbi:MAG: hypothetical protein AAF411_18305 [Myxococcota bacterium]